jgi:DNA-binding HxlR family transcriptional regulator
MPRFEFRGKYYNNPVDIIGGKWKMPILWRLKERSWRYGELKKNIGKITHKMLAEQLKELEQDGLISRKVYPEVPPKVEYSLTERGFSTIPIIEGLRAWGSSFRENKI